ncbi:pentapeptide repeat-containing protein [Rothia mucilaginosa]|uniref:pentapeptide repeat-containing protein n=1 Tax=Rothia mucilaginosa TaxID=43675 RepID=UPI0028E9C208|nr:pentapeptide repeat-containing protein [Rothia mucilaginosa]
MTPNPSPSPTHLIIPTPGPATWDVIAQWLAIGLLTTGTVIFVAFVAEKLVSSDKKREIKSFYLWIAAIAFFGGLLSFFLPIAINSGFNKDDDGSRLRQALLYTTGGLLGVITLGETHRKNDLEKEKNEQDHVRQVYAERRSRYTTAVEQLANEKAAVRLGGIYTLVGLADEWLADDSLTKDKQQEEGQVIINNLCSYVRSPFPHAELRELFEKNNPEESIPEKDRDEFLKKQAQFREEQNIRHTILVETTNRLSNQNEKPENKEKIPQKGLWSDFSYNFSGTHFLYNVDFRNIVVNSPINFSHSIFGQIISFYNSIFEGEVFFTGSKFEKTSSFINVTFKQISFFHEAEFEGVVSFKESKFNDSAIFHDTVFGSTTSFESTHFKEKADFKDVNFTGHTSFSTAKFKGEAIFIDTTFKKIISAAVDSPKATADFNNAIFENTTDFRDAYFEGFANFSNAIFGGNANFASATFKVSDGFADFTDATFDKSANFLSTTFLGPLGFYRAKFITKEPRFAFQESLFLAARFSCSVTPEHYIFNVSPHSPHKIRLGESELNGKKFIIPEGTILFEPELWNFENQDYKNMSNPAVSINEQSTILQKINLLFP